ncbi:MAG: DegT/DnrJ/EryC1/StrS family aminotransferase, partial [Actinomycetota bacterium]
LGRGIALFGEEERAEVLEVLESRSLFRYYGPALLRKVEGFEDAICKAFGTKHAVATSSGTAGLRTALAALGVGCGDEVIVPAFTFIATVNAVVASGAVPVFTEIDDTLNLDPGDLESKITQRTTAVIPVHLENVACEMEKILEISRRAHISLVEDTAQSMGATYRGRALGTFGDLGVFSLQLEKNVTAGEGGVVITDDERLYLRAARYQDQGGQFVTSHGKTRGGDLDQPFVGENLRMSEIAGAIAGAQLKKLPAIIEAMRKNKDQILEAIGNVPGMQRRRIPDPAGDGSSSTTWFLPEAEIARSFVRALIAEGIPSAQIYDGKPVYAAPSILARRTASGKGGPWNCAEHPTSVEYRMGMCPRTEDLVSRSVTVGVGAAFTEKDCDDVASAVLKVSSQLLG